MKEITQHFFVIPEQYIAKGGSSNSDGILVEEIQKNGTKKAKFIPTTIYKREKKLCYISEEELSAGMIVYNKSDADTYQLKQTKKLN